MAEKETKVVEEQPNPGETVSRAEFDAVVAERDQYKAAVEKLINAMANNYAQGLYKEVMSPTPVNPFPGQSR